MKIETLYRSPETKNDSLIKNNNILITQNYVNRAYYLISFYGHSKVLFPDSKETWERINQKSIFWRQHGVETRRRSRDALPGLVFVETCRTLCWSEFVSFFLESLRIQCRMFLISFLSEPHEWHYLLLNSAFGSRYLTIIDWGWVWSELLWKPRRLLPAEADNNLRYLFYHSDHTTTESNKCFICYSKWRFL